MLNKTFATLLLTLALFAGTANAATQQTSAAATQQTSQTQATQNILPPGMPANNEGFTIVPAYPNEVNARKFIYELKPGTSVTDYAYVKNFSSRTVSFALYGADPTVSNKGTLAYKTKAESGQDTGKWMQFEQPVIQLGPTEAKMVKFTITIPQDTSYGDYRIGAAMERTSQDTGNPSITIATRIVLHTEIKVTNDPQPIKLQKGSTDNSSWKAYYFWISLLLFLISLGLVVWTTFINPREKEQREPKKPAAKKRVHHTKNEGKRRNPRV